MLEAAIVLASLVLPGDVADSAIPPNEACVAGLATPEPAAMLASSTWIMSVGAAARIDISALCGRHISVREVRVERVTDDGFWIGNDGEEGALFVVPAEGSLVHVAVGELVDLQGEFRTMKRATDQHHGSADIVLFVYAYTVRHTP